MNKTDIINAQEEKIIALNQINKDLESRVTRLSQSIEVDQDTAFSNG